MKKFIVSILAVLYLGSSSGATIHLHYCMGKLVEWGLWHKKSDKCSKCGMEMANKGTGKDCCKDEHKQIQIDKDQKTVENTFQLAQFSGIALDSGFIIYQDTVISSVTEKYPKSNAPARSREQPLFLLNCIFLI